MNFYEYNDALGQIEVQRELVLRLSLRDITFKKEFSILINLLITVKAHAWCMDVAAERAKMTKLIVDEIDDLLKQSVFYVKN